LNLLHWPTSYPDESIKQPYTAVFVKEHILSTQGLVNNRVLFISPEGTNNNNKWHQQIDTVEDGVPVTRFYFNRNLNVHFLNVYIRLVVMLYFLRLIIIYRFYPNIIHIHFHQSFFWAKLFSKIFDIPIIITEHWSAFLGWPDIGKTRYQNAAKAFNYARRILPVSIKIQKGIQEYTAAAIDKKSIVIPNAVDTTIFKYTKNEVNSSEIKNICFVGRNAEEKDIPTLLKGIAATKAAGIHLKLHVVGDGDYYNINEITTEYGLKNEIILHGQQNKTYISKLLNKCDLLLLTSTIENSPCVIGEAHCCGVPVVASNVGGISELIIEGAVFEPKNISELAEKIIRWLNKDINKTELAHKAAHKFGYESIGKQLYNVYKTVCAE
jgi:glycosyltransferase involved in cell wall biosynthesis